MSIRKIGFFNYYAMTTAIKLDALLAKMDTIILIQSTLRIIPSYTNYKEDNVQVSEYLNKKGNLISMYALIIH